MLVLLLRPSAGLAPGMTYKSYLCVFFACWLFFILRVSLFFPPPPPNPESLEPHPLKALWEVWSHAQCWEWSGIRPGWETRIFANLLFSVGGRQGSSYPSKPPIQGSAEASPSLLQPAEDSWSSWQGLPAPESPNYTPSSICVSS